MSKPGEINNLSKLIKPDIGIIINIGEAHIEISKILRALQMLKEKLLIILVKMEL